MNRNEVTDTALPTAASLTLGAVLLMVCTTGLFLVSRLALAPGLRWVLLGAIVCVQAALALRFLLHFHSEPRWLRVVFWMVLFFAIALVVLPTLAQWGSATI